MIANPIEPSEDQPIDSTIQPTETQGPRRGRVVEVLAVATRLGLTSFGGPVAHFGYFRDEYVGRRRWVDDATFADLVALSQSLPGPASSKVGIAIGVLRAGLPGGFAAWIGFTLPSAIALVAFAYGVQSLGDDAAGWLHGLRIVAVAVVALAVWSMARAMAFDLQRGSIAILAAIATLVWQTAFTQVLVIAAAGIVGWRLLPAASTVIASRVVVPLGRRAATVSAGLLIGLLVLLPLLREATGSQTVAVLDSFFRAGSLVFGGGHVVLPLLEAEVVAPGWVTTEQFLAGYGAAQAVPGPLFSFSAYLGAVMGLEPNGLGGATLALVAIFLPGFLLTVATLPSWGAVRTRPGVQGVLRGINAAVVGILLAALYDPVATSAIVAPVDVGLALAAFGALALLGLPAWLVVLLTAAAGAVVA